MSKLGISLWLTVKWVGKAVPNIALKTDISGIKNKRKMQTAEKDFNLSAFNSDTRTDYYWRSVFEIKTICENSKYVKLPSLVFFWHSSRYKIAIAWLKDPFQIIATLVTPKMVTFFLFIIGKVTHNYLQKKMKW